VATKSILIISLPQSTVAYAQIARELVSIESGADRCYCKCDNESVPDLIESGEPWRKDREIPSFCIL
jgi:hypothetical protein